MINKKILFVANKAPHYRIPFFNGLVKKIPHLDFLFTQESSKIRGLNAKYKSLKGFGRGRAKINMKLRSEILNYDLVVFLPTDFSNIIDNLILYNTCKRKKIPYLIWSERWEYKKIPFKDKIASKIYKKIILGSSGVVVPGIKSFEYHKKIGLEKNKIFVSPNASEIEFKKKDISKKIREIRKRYNLKNKKIILYLGRLINRKGVDYLIDAYSKLGLDNVALLIVGGGDFYKFGEKSVEYKLKNLVKSKGIRDVIFTGEVNHEDAPAYYILSDIFVYPSVTEKISEPWGLSLNEAMQFELPIISTDAVGSAYDLINNEKNGFMVKEKNSEELKNAIRKIINNNDILKKMGKESLKIKRDKFNYSNMVKGFLTAIENALENRENEK